MTTIQIKYFNLAAVYMDKKTERRELASETTCYGLIEILAGENESFRKLAIDVDGNVSNRLRIFRNGKIMTSTNEILAQNDEIIFFSAISGG